MNLEVVLAKKAVAEYLNTGGIFQPSPTLPDELLKKRAGVFVCLYKDVQLRGCMGTVKPSKKNIAKEIIANAILAAVSDQRFSPLQKDDLPEISFAVYIVDKIEKVKDQNQLNPREYGVMIKSKWFGLKSAVALPNADKYQNAEQQIREACLKAGLVFGKDQFSVFRFAVKKYL